MKFGMQPITCDLFKIMLTSVHKTDIPGPLLMYFINNAFNIVLYSDSYKPISFKLGLMTDMTKHYSLNV